MERFGHSGGTRWDALLIAGPTASGKSALAIRLARSLGGIVINTDAMQVYRDLRIITARPSVADEALAPHALFGTQDGAENFSAGLWLAAAQRALEGAKQNGLLPIFTGGTGLYFKALTQGLSEIPAVPDDIRARIRHEAEGHTPEDLHARLAALDPLAAARLRPSDPQRILRALEVYAATGRSLDSFHDRRAAPLLNPERCRGIFLAIERPVLRERIDRRFDEMMRQGALDEVEGLAARCLDPLLPVMRTLGVPPLLRHLRGDLPLSDAVIEAKAATRRYIKRQETFARHQLPALPFINAAEAESHLLRDI